MQVFLESLKEGQVTKYSLSTVYCDDKVVHDIDGVLRAWEKYFDNLSTPKDSAQYDTDHFYEVNNFVNDKIKCKDIDQFTKETFTCDEINKAISKLHNSPGYDLVTTEHIKNAGPMLVRVLTKLFNICIEMQCIPENVIRGVQIPIYKGKNTCSLDPGNYRGITLLTSFNKLFEVILWSRLEV